MALLYVLTLAVLTLPGVYIHFVTPEQKEMIVKTFHSVYFILLPPGKLFFFLLQLLQNEDLCINLRVKNVSVYLLSNYIQLLI